MSKQVPIVIDDETYNTWKVYCIETNQYMSTMIKKAVADFIISNPPKAQSEIRQPSEGWITKFITHNGEHIHSEIFKDLPKIYTIKVQDTGSVMFFLLASKDYDTRTAIYTESVTTHLGVGV